MNDPRMCTPCLRKACSRVTSASPCIVEVLEHRLQTFRRHRLHADECTSDPRPPHGVEELRILGGLHGDLRVEDHVVGQLFEQRHQLEPFLADGLQLGQPWRRRYAAGRREVRERHGVEVVVGEQNEAEALAPQRDDLPHDGRMRDAGAAPVRRSARPNRTSSAWGSRAPSAPTPTCSDRPAAGPSEPPRTTPR